jgi:hypothetical protein
VEGNNASEHMISKSVPNFAPILKDHMKDHIVVYGIQVVAMILPIA